MDNKTDDTPTSKIEIKNDINKILLEISNNILNDFANSNNYENINIKLKDKLISKITNNINIVNKLYDYYIFNYNEEKMTSIYNHLKIFSTIQNTNAQSNISYYKTLKITLGHLIYDIYRDSNYHIIMTNVPTRAVPIANNKINDIDNMELINSENIQDTLEHFNGLDTIYSVFQVTSSTYLVKFKLYSDAEKICSILNKMQMGGNIIKVELLEHNPNLLPNKESVILHVEEKEEKEEKEEQEEPIQEIVESIPSVSSVPSVSVSDIEDIDIGNDNEYQIENIKDIEIENIKIAEIEANTNIITSNDTKNTDTNSTSATSATSATSSSTGNLLVVDLAYGLYNKVTSGFGLFNYFRRG
jgi:hypothetical protein